MKQTDVFLRLLIKKFTQLTDLHLTFTILIVYFIGKKEVNRLEEKVETPLNKKRKKRKSQVKRLKEKIQEKEKEIEELRNKYLHSLADYDNLRKRVKRDMEEVVKYANEVLIKKLLIVLDNFERALRTSKEGKTAFKDFYKGVEMIYQEFLSILTKEGLEPFESKGKDFDPSQHEAVGVIETEEHPPMKIIEEVEKGYKYRDKVLKPAKVLVSKEKSKKEVDENG